MQASLEFPFLSSSSLLVVNWISSFLSNCVEVGQLNKTNGNGQDKILVPMKHSVAEADTYQLAPYTSECMFLFYMSTIRNCKWWNLKYIGDRVNSHHMYLGT